MTRLRRAVATVGFCCVVGGCAGLPTSGPITHTTVQDPGSHEATRYEPAKPRRGASPQQILDGYVDAMLAHPQATAVVQAFLTREAAAGWNPGPGMAVYSTVRSQVGKPTLGSASASLEFYQMLTIDAEGRASVDAKTVTVPLTLTQQDGQWRVATPMPGYLVSSRFASDYVRAFPLWFFDRQGDRLVAELTHALVSPQSAAELIQRLVDGPREASLRTYVPETARVRVEVRGTTAELNFTGAEPESRDRFRAQVLSTVRGVPGIEGVRILFDGAPDGGVHGIDAVVGFGPRSVPNRVYGVADTGVVSVTNRARPVDGRWSVLGRDTDAVAMDSENVAVVDRGRATVVVGGRTTGELQSIRGRNFANPSWDDQHRLWLVDQTAGSRVQVVESGRVRQIQADLPAGVESFAISPDSARYVAAVGGGDDRDVIVGFVERDGDGRPIGLAGGRRVSAGLRGERAVGWVSQTRVAFLASTHFGPQLHSVGFDGADRSVPSARDAVPDGGITAWAGPPADGADRWALDRSGGVWRQRPGGIWSKLDDTKLLALSSGR